jgi:hypothetical protein
MCLDKKCGRIDIIEIYDNIKVVLHYSKDSNEPFFIQYWDKSQPFPAKEVSLEFDIRKPVKTGRRTRRRI